MKLELGNYLITVGNLLDEMESQNKIGKKKSLK